MIPEKSIRLHTFHDQVAISTPNTKQLYLTPEDALVLATELRRFAKGCLEDKWYCTRIIENGKAKNESDKKRKPIILS